MHLVQYATSLASHGALVRQHAHRATALPPKHAAHGGQTTKPGGQSGAGWEEMATGPGGKGGEGGTNDGAYGYGACSVTRGQCQPYSGAGGSANSGATRQCIQRGVTGSQEGMFRLPLCHITRTPNGDGDVRMHRDGCGIWPARCSRRFRTQGAWSVPRGAAAMTFILNAVDRKEGHNSMLF